MVSPTGTVTSSVAPSVGAASIDIEDFAKPSKVFTKERKASELAEEVRLVIDEKQSTEKTEGERSTSTQPDIVTTETPRSRRSSARSAGKAAASQKPESPVAFRKEDTPPPEKETAPVSDTLDTETESTLTPGVSGVPSSPTPGTSAETAKTTASERFEKMLEWLDRNNAGKLEQSEIEAVEVKPGKYELQAHGMPVVFKEITVS